MEIVIESKSTYSIFPYKKIEDSLKIRENIFIEIFSNGNSVKRTQNLFRRKILNNNSEGKL